MNIKFVLVALAVLCASCAALVPPDPMPLLRLSPTSLGHSLSLQQELWVEVNERRQRVEVLLEVDSESVRMALLNSGQTMARLEWDGQQLKATRATWLPAGIHADRILSDLQLVLWPVAAIRAALPEGWVLEGDAPQRVLSQRGEAVVRVNFPTPTRADLIQLRDGYRISIESRSLGAPL